MESYELDYLGNDLGYVMPLTDEVKSSKNKLSLPDLSTFRMLCYKHGMPCFRGDLEGLWYCPSEHHSDPILETKSKT